MNECKKLLLVPSVIFFATVLLWSSTRIDPSALPASEFEPYQQRTAASLDQRTDATAAPTTTTTTITTTTTTTTGVGQRPAEGANNITTQTSAPKLLCWILTIDTPANRVKSDAVRATWGKRCDKLLLVQNGSQLAEHDNGVLTLPLVRESRDELWHKVVAAFTYIHAHHLADYDWFMKADDDTYVVVDTLKRFLSKHSPETPVYFGHRFKPYVRQGYMSGGSGYVLSRRALQLLQEEGIAKRRPECHLEQGTIEDVEMGHCLQAVGVEAGDTRDALGRPTFLPLSPVMLLSEPNLDAVVPWYNQYQFYGPRAPGKDCCSTEPMSFHYIEPSLMHFIDWMLYDVKRTTDPQQQQHTGQRATR